MRWSDRIRNLRSRGSHRIIGLDGRTGSICQINPLPPYQPTGQTAIIRVFDAKRLWYRDFHG